MLREKERRGLEGGRESPGNLESVGSVERGSVLFTEIIAVTGPAELLSVNYFSNLGTFIY